MKKRNLSGLVMYSYSKDGAFKTAQQLKGIHRFKLVSERGRESVKGGVGVGGRDWGRSFFFKECCFTVSVRVRDEWLKHSLGSRDPKRIGRAQY